MDLGRGPAGSLLADSRPAGLKPASPAPRYRFRLPAALSHRHTSPAGLAVSPPARHRHRQGAGKPLPSSSYAHVCNSDLVIRPRCLNLQGKPRKLPSETLETLGPLCRSCGEDEQTTNSGRPLAQRENRMPQGERPEEHRNDVLTPAVQQRHAVRGRGHMGRGRVENDANQNVEGDEETSSAEKRLEKFHFRSHSSRGCR